MDRSLFHKTHLSLLPSPVKMDNEDQAEQSGVVMTQHSCFISNVL